MFDKGCGYLEQFIITVICFICSSHSNNFSNNCSLSSISNINVPIVVCFSTRGKRTKASATGWTSASTDGKILAHDGIWSIPLDNNKQDCALCHNKLENCNICHRKLQASKICLAPVCADSEFYSVCTKGRFHHCYWRD